MLLSMSRVGTVSRRHQLCYAVSLLLAWPCEGTANNVPTPRLRVRVARPRSLTDGESTRGVGAAATTRSERLKRRAGCEREVAALQPALVGARLERWSRARSAGGRRCLQPQRQQRRRREGNGVEQSRKGRMKRFWTSLLGFASLLAPSFCEQSAGARGKGREALVGTGRVQLRERRWTAVASAAELAATEAADRSANASAWQEELATALSKTNNATALKALGPAQSCRE
ncbi:hypothetical protein ERJ75_000606100 [Trypanosoma vivax]|nr:hypothetical protein ERJ75_000606100 [Trypanosoma vivax]